MKTILLIDNSDDLKITKQLLELNDYKVYAANNGKIGIVLAIEEHPDLVICDVNIQGFSGYGVLRILKMNHETSDIPFIFLSENKNIRKGMSMGADDYLIKPFDKDDLLTAIKTRIDKIKQVRSNIRTSANEVENKVELASIIEGKKVKVLGEKQVAYAEGDSPNYLYYILKGEIKTIKTDIYGKIFVNDIYEPGNYFGYKALLLESEYTESAIALKRSEVVLIPKKDFWMLLKSNRQIAALFIRMLAKNLSSKGERLLQMAYTPVRERVATALLQLKNNKENSGDLSNHIKISREDMASLVGTVRVSLNKVIAEFKNEGLIDADRKNIIIKNESALKRVIEH